MIKRISILMFYFSVKKHGDDFDFAWLRVCGTMGFLGTLVFTPFLSAILFYTKDSAFVQQYAKIIGQSMVICPWLISALFIYSRKKWKGQAIDNLRTNIPRVYDYYLYLLGFCCIIFFVFGGSFFRRELLFLYTDLIDFNPF